MGLMLSRMLPLGTAPPSPYGFCMFFVVVVVCLFSAVCWAMYCNDQLGGGGGRGVGGGGRAGKMWMSRSCHGGLLGGFTRAALCYRTVLFVVFLFVLFLFVCLWLFLLLLLFSCFVFCDRP